MHVQPAIQRSGHYVAARRQHWHTAAQARQVDKYWTGTAASALPRPNASTAVELSILRTTCLPATQLKPHVGQAPPPNPQAQLQLDDLLALALTAWSASAKANQICASFQSPWGLEGYRSACELQGRACSAFCGHCIILRLRACQTR